MDDWTAALGEAAAAGDDRTVVDVAEVDAAPADLDQARPEGPPVIDSAALGG